jgi:hypothetical protein
MVGLGWAGRRSLIFVSGIPTLFAAYERSSGWSLIVTSPQIVSEASAGAELIVKGFNASRAHRSDQLNQIGSLTSRCQPEEVCR